MGVFPHARDLITIFKLEKWLDSWQWRRFTDLINNFTYGSAVTKCPVYDLLTVHVISYRIRISVL